jgi:hypothetical protein
MHLLASALLSHCGFWTLDKRLGAAAAELGLISLPARPQTIMIG